LPTPATSVVRMILQHQHKDTISCPCFSNPAREAASASKAPLMGSVAGLLQLRAPREQPVPQSICRLLDAMPTQAHWLMSCLGNCSAGCSLSCRLPVAHKLCCSDWLSPSSSASSHFVFFWTFLLHSITRDDLEVEAGRKAAWRPCIQSSQCAELCQRLCQSGQRL
jgi:hypothetical protein